MHASAVPNVLRLDFKSAYVFKQDSYKMKKEKWCFLTYLSTSISVARFCRWFDRSSTVPALLVAGQRVGMMIHLIKGNFTIQHTVNGNASIGILR
jgi:hypothetical protein